MSDKIEPVSNIEETINEDYLGYAVYVIYVKDKIPPMNYLDAAISTSMPINVFKMALEDRARPICRNIGYYTAKNMARRLTDLGFVSIFYNESSEPLYSACYEEDDSRFERTCMRIIEAVTLISKTQCKADAEKYAQDILEIAKMQNLRILSVFERVVKEFKEADENTFRELQKILFEKE